MTGILVSIFTSKEAEKGTPEYFGAKNIFCIV